MVWPNLTQLCVGSLMSRPVTARPGTTVVEVTGKALLPAIEIDSGNAPTGFHQGNGNINGGGGFSRSTFLTSKHDDVRRTGSI
jgi:hypothetical protein